MAHKTLIGGTAYEISGGKTLIDGTAYSIKNGKTLIGGTAYEVGFSPKTPVVTIKGNVTNATSAQKYFSLTVDGQTYIGNCGTVELEVPIGTLIECSVSPTMSNAARIVKGNNSSGTILAEAAKGGSSITYIYEVTGDVTFTMGAVSFSYNYITIAEE